LTSDGNGTIPAPPSPFPQDADIDLPPASSDSSFAQTAYRIPRIPKGKYVLTYQTLNDGSFILLEHDPVKDYRLKFFLANEFPSDVLDGFTVAGIYDCEESTSGGHLVITATTGEATVISKLGSAMLNFVADTDWVRNQAAVDKIAISVWPSLEYRQMYSDAWRLMRDYFYDANMHNVNWPVVYTKYLPLVQRCGKREELDDVLGQMASETSALHSFVYGGEYASPDSSPLEPASLGAFLKRSQEWKGFMVQEIPQRDPDFDLVNGEAVYCPISDQALRPTGQRGLEIGDVIVAVNGESVVTVPDINMMLRGTAGRSIRLEVLRLSSGNNSSLGSTVASTEPLVVVPISVIHADALRYNAWEWKTRELAKSLAKDSGFSVGYIHMQAMDRNGEDAFARGYYPDYDKDALILDVRHNMGGNIDSWILTTLQRQAFMYWAPRSGNARNGELDWDEQFSFRGKVVVLVDELTASNGEGVARGISELGIGKVIGTRTWGGGIWGSSSNVLVDDGLAAAPQWGIFNDRFGWGGGIEMTGVEPDIVVDNDPFISFNGRDMQLERAISELSAWLKSDPISAYKTPAGSRPDMSLHDDCPA
jgi:tricorn protease